MTMTMLESIVCVLILMLLLILLLIFLVCKPWRFFSSSSRSRTIKVGELEKPLVPDDVVITQNQRNELPRDYNLEGVLVQNEGHFRSPRTHGLVHKQRLPPVPTHITQGDSIVLDIISGGGSDVLLGQTLKRPLTTEHFAEFLEHGRQSLEDNRFQENRDILSQRSVLTLEVISGPSRGAKCSVQSTNNSRLPLTLGRVSPSDLLLKDSEVSGKHAMINWNLNKMRWELVDMGSLNGTLLNSQPINHPDSGSRHWGDPMELASRDIITLGTTSRLYVHITSQTECRIPFGVGVASDPMALRRGGKKLPMEDVSYYQWPLPGADQFGLFGICDGHGGAGAAKYASKILPEIIATILTDSLKRERVLSLCDASDVLRDAFFQTESCMNHCYENLVVYAVNRATVGEKLWGQLPDCKVDSEHMVTKGYLVGSTKEGNHEKGCTATVLLVWVDGDGNFFAQGANVGDSGCIMNVDGQHIKMTEDHKITSRSERLRIAETGERLKDGETRLCGLNLARMLGDKFLKQQDSRFSSEPYISQVVHISPSSGAFALLASDGLWDVISVKKATELVLQTREICSAEENSAEKIANCLLSEARTLRTKDNTAIIFLDFDTARISCKDQS